MDILNGGLRNGFQMAADECARVPRPQAASAAMAIQERIALRLAFATSG